MVMQQMTPGHPRELDLSFEALLAHGADPNGVGTGVSCVRRRGVWPEGSISLGTNRWMETTFCFDCIVTTLQFLWFG